jgi:hypothetical protein
MRVFSRSLFATLSFALLGSAATPPASSKADFAPLLAYQGTWHVMRKDAKDPKPDILINHCSLLGQFFACAQNVNAQPGALVVFLHKGAPGHFLVQNIMPDGRATGLTDLTVNGDTWTYMDRRDENGQTTFYRTLNVFSGRNKIHFESSHSKNGKDYSVDLSGDESRVSQ